MRVDIRDYKISLRCGGDSMQEILDLSIFLLLILNIVQMCNVIHYVVNVKKSIKYFYYVIILCVTCILLYDGYRFLYLIGVWFSLVIAIQLYVSCAIKSKLRVAFHMIGTMLHFSLFVSIIMSITYLVQDRLRPEMITCLQMSMMSIFGYSIIFVSKKDKTRIVPKYCKQLSVIYVIEILLNAVLSFYIFKNVNLSEILFMYHLFFSCAQLMFNYVLLHQFETLQDTQELKQQLHFVEKQLENQIQRYQFNVHQIEQIRVFKHDYLASIHSIETLLEKKKYEKASELIQNIKTTIADPTKYYKQFSNNIYVDALVHDIYKQAKQQSIKFDVKALLGNLAISDIAICRVMKIIFDYAIAVNMHDLDQKYICLNSVIEQNWQKIILECSSEINELSDLNKWNEKFEEIREIIEGNGFATFEKKEGNTVFEGYICISLKNERVDKHDFFSSM